MVFARMNECANSTVTQDKSPSLAKNSQNTGLSVCPALRDYTEASAPSSAHSVRFLHQMMGSGQSTACSVFSQKSSEV